MRGFLASSIGVTCAAALALPLTPPAAASVRPALGAEAARSGATATVGSASGRADADTPVPGSTQSLPLVPLTRDRSAGTPTEQGLPPQDVRHFSLVGVVWDDPATELHGRVQVRTRAVATGTWSDWQDVETHNAEHAADPGTAESAAGGVRGATAPLWVGESDGVQVRVTAEGADPDPGATKPKPEAAEPKPKSEAEAPKSEVAGPKPKSEAEAPKPKSEAPKPKPKSEAAEPKPKSEAAAEPKPESEAVVAQPKPEPEEGEQGGDDAAVDGTAVTPLPAGLHLELVDPGDPAQSEPGPRPGSLNPETLGSAEALAASAANAELAPLGATEIPALERAETEREMLALRGSELTEEQRAKPYIGPRPRIVTRRGWGANESWRERQFAYTNKVKAAFVHHTASGGKYWCTQAPSLIRGIYRYHVLSMGWRDIGYNFLVDKCGNIYEGRAGGVTKAVLGAHTRGFNSNSMGIAVLGSYGSTKPTVATVNAISRLTAWKLGLYGANPRGKTYLTSGGGNLFRKGRNVRLNVISGHRDGFSTECPGRLLYAKLGTARASAARLQGR
ncbi:N-acetylmuramoyl-L-alanine amidase [Streptomyces sp. WAC 01325]|uniref:peptidoglycan recognition protein family protein n=1 Tax=Streptomyces sp. WAC 01325 TaxID=2203202 RepID=UPI000F87A96B|nr:peptidoglycan recognition protein [Streptomyces sp. WAC 01325]RSM84169.1 N-acetylmuramoyl-L-alanine amidase [Streptomyces sp. WAC 01325]